jgi:phosphoribosylaminoimidazole-succinocarboxamide synthase
VVLQEPIPGKGELLTQMALFWFDKLKDIVPNHLTGEDAGVGRAGRRAPRCSGRAMLVKRLRPLPVEAVVRGYLAGSAGRNTRPPEVCGVPLPAGLRNAVETAQPIFTPATKAEAGEHDENITFEQHRGEMIGPALAAEVRDTSDPLYKAAAAYALPRASSLPTPSSSSAWTPQGAWC